MVEKTDRTKNTSGPSQTGKRAAKKAARKTGKTAAGKSRKSAAKKPANRKSAAGKGRKRAPANTTPNTIEDLAVAKEERAARRIAGGQDAETQDTEASIPSDPAPDEIKPAVVARVPKTGKRGKIEPRPRPGENADGSPRPNTLVPTNGIHTTQRRLKRKLHQNRGLMGLVAATLLGIVILGEQTAPPDLTEFEQEIAASRTIETYAGARVATPPPGIIQPTLRHEAAALPDPEAGGISEGQDKTLNDGELVEMERLLARLDLGPSTADGIVDNQTEAAIRLYQEIAGLTIDGTPSRTLLADMREVVKILEGDG